MSYQAVVQMANSSSLLQRVAAAAAEEGMADPMDWAQRNLWKVVSSPGWRDAWSYAEDVKTVNQNPDTGIRTDVINDDMILAAVQPLVQEALATA